MSYGDQGVTGLSKRRVEWQGRWYAIYKGGRRKEKEGAERKMVTKMKLERQIPVKMLNSLREDTNSAQWFKVSSVILLCITDLYLPLVS